MNPENRQPIEVHSSLMNLFDKSILYTTGWPVGAFIDTIHEAGYLGLEWHPIRNLLAGSQMNMGLVSGETKKSITSLHQSWRSERSFAEAVRTKNPFIVAFYVVLPERVQSLNDLERLQKVLGHELPVVLYPNKPWEESGTTRPFAQKMFQPTPEVMRDWGTRNVEELIGQMYQRNYTGFCLDLYHMRDRSEYGGGIHQWQDTLPFLLPHTQEIHVSAGRVDRELPHVDSLEELKSLLHPNQESELTQMLDLIRKLGWKGKVVTEVPALGLHHVRAKSHSFSSVSNLIDDHRQIVERIQSILS
jgi:hypothetical protein